MVADVISRLVGGAILATGGWRLGEYIADTWGPELYAPWVFGLTIGGVVVGLVGTPWFASKIIRNFVDETHTISTSGLLSSAVGLVLGLIVALLISIPVSRVPGWLGVALPISLSLFLAYLGAMIMSAPSRDMFKRIIPEQGSRESPPLSGIGAVDNSNSTKILLDTSAIIDGRIAGIGAAGFLQGTVLIPRFVLDELRHIADSSDSMRRSRRRGVVRGDAGRRVVGARCGNDHHSEDSHGSEAHQSEPLDRLRLGVPHITALVPRQRSHQLGNRPGSS